MGTNFYYRRPGILGIGTVEEKHIGKKSAGWQFMFRGHKDITSWVEWKEVLTRAKAGKIFDEYDKEWTPAEFIAMVEASKPAKRHDNYERGRHGLLEWTDREGWSFSLTEFC